MANPMPGATNPYPITVTTANPTTAAPLMQSKIISGLPAPTMPTSPTPMIQIPARQGRK